MHAPVSLEKVAPNPETQIDWHREYIELHQRWSLLREKLECPSDRDRLMYLANIDDGAILSAIEGTDYDTWCTVIDNAIARERAIEHDEDLITADFEDDEFDDDDDYGSFDGIIAMVLSCAFIGVVFSGVADLFSVPHPDGIGALAFLACLVQAIRGAWYERY